MIDVASHDDRAVFGSIPTVEELLAVVELVRHILDVGQEPDRCMLVRVGCVRLVLHRFIEEQERRRRTLVVFAEHGARASFWKSALSYLRLRNRSASTSTTVGSAEEGTVMW